MTKIAKNQKMPQPGSDENDDTPPAEDAETAKDTSLFKPRLEGDDFIEPLDVEDLGDFGEDPQPPSSIADQGAEKAIKQHRWTMLLPDEFEDDDLDRESRALSLLAMGKPRTVQLAFGPVTYMRLTDAIEKRANAGDGARDDDGYHRKQQAALRLDADSPAKLIGPHTEHAVDEVISATYARAPAFAPVLDAIRASAHLSLKRGANFFHFRPLLIVSAPGMGKTTLIRLLAEAAGLPIIRLDGSMLISAEK